MVNAAEGCVGDDVERLLAAIIGMRAPTDVGEQTGGMPQPLVVNRFVELGREHEVIGPVAQLLAMQRRAGPQHIEVPGRGDERIRPPLRQIQPLVQKPLAHAKSRNDNIARLGAADDLVKHDCAMRRACSPI